MQFIKETVQLDITVFQELLLLPLQYLELTEVLFAQQEVTVQLDLLPLFPVQQAPSEQQQEEQLLQVAQTALQALTAWLQELRLSLEAVLLDSGALSTQPSRIQTFAQKETNALLVAQQKPLAQLQTIKT